MDLKEQKTFYDTYWNHQKLNSLKLRRFVKIMDLFTLVKRKIKHPIILDLGCGDGRLTSILGEFGHADGLELSQKAVDKANAQYPHVNYFSGNALDYQLKQDFYDLVISQEVIEHIWEQEAYIDVCYKSLKKGGYLILTTPNKDVLDHMINGDKWSNQPIENVITSKTLKTMIKSRFKLIEFDSIILNFGSKGKYGIVNSRLLIGLTNKLGLKKIRARALGKLGFGLHMCILAQKL